MIPNSMDSAMRLAEMMSRGKLVPQHLQNSAGDCLMVIEQATRWAMSPFAVAQCTSVIQGKLMFEGKLVAAALNSSGILERRLDYSFTGTGLERTILVRGRLRGETESREITLSLKDAKTTNGMWQKQPDQQLVYAGTRVWARRHAPEVMLGVYSPEEFEATATPAAFAGETIEGKADPVPEPTPEPEPKPTTRKLTPSTLIERFVSAQTRQEYFAIMDDKDVVGAMAWLEANKPALHTAVEDAKRKAWARLSEPPQQVENAPEMADAASDAIGDEVPF